MIVQRSSTVLNNANGNDTANHIINFYDIQIVTTVTNRASVVAEWIRQVYSKHSGTRIVVAVVSDNYEILQLCVEKTCLIFQLHHKDEFPQALQNFFNDYDVMFVRVPKYGFVAGLKRESALDCSRCIQVMQLVTGSYMYSIESKHGTVPTLLELAKHIEGLTIEKPRFVKNSNWKAERLYVEQIRYASIDAYATYRIARTLLSTNN